MRYPTGDEEFWLNPMTSWRTISILILLWIAVIATAHLFGLEVDFVTDHAFFILLCLILIFTIRLIEWSKWREIRKMIDEPKSVTLSNWFMNLSLFTFSLVFVISLILQVPEVEGWFLDAWSGRISKLFDFLYQYSSQLRATLIMLASYIAFIMIILILSWKAIRIESIRDSIKGKISKEIGVAYLFLIGVLWFIYLSWAALTRHNTFHSKAWDLAIFAQLIDNFKNGIFFEANVRGLDNVFSDHFTPIIYIFSPLLYMWNDPSRLLLVIQALFITLGAIPVYLLTMKKKGSRTASFAISCAYLFLPTLQFINLADFHPVVLAIPLLLSAWYAWECRRYRMMYLFIFLSMMCQEEIWILIGSMGLFLALFERERKHGIILTVLGWGGFIALILWFFPYFREGSEYFYFHRYAYLGSSGEEIVRNLILHPAIWLGKLFSSRILMFIILMLLPVGFLPLWRPKYLLMLLPTLFYSALSNEPLQTSIFAQYAASYVPFLIITSVYGMNRSLSLQPVVVTLLVASLMSNVFFSPLPHGYAYQEGQLTKEANHPLFKNSLLKLTKCYRNINISADSKFAPHLIRRNLFLFPDCWNADYHIIDLDDHYNPEEKVTLQDALDRTFAVSDFETNIIMGMRSNSSSPLLRHLQESFFKSPQKPYRRHIQTIYDSKGKSAGNAEHKTDSDEDIEIIGVSERTIAEIPTRYLWIDSICLFKAELFKPYQNLINLNELTLKFTKPQHYDDDFFGIFIYNRDFSDGLRLRKKVKFNIINFGYNLLSNDKWTEIYQKIIPAEQSEEYWIEVPEKNLPILLLSRYPEDYPNTLEEYFQERVINGRLNDEINNFINIENK